MTSVKEIEKAIVGLLPEQLAELRAWFDAFDARLFDAAVEQDIRAGKLDKLAEDALVDYKRATRATYEAFREP